MKLHVRMLLFENPSELLSLGIMGNGVHEEDVTGDVHVAGEIVPHMGHDGLLGDPCPGPLHHSRVYKVITKLSVIRTLKEKKDGFSIFLTQIKRFYPDTDFIHLIKLLHMLLQL